MDNRIVIIKYNAGNVLSVQNALKRIGRVGIVSDDPDLIVNSSHVIFPGVGEASTAMQYLKERELDKIIISLKQPVLGICLGMQLMCESSEENNTQCLGIFSEKVKRFPAGSLKVPQVGWNSISQLKSALFEKVEDNTFVYSVHSYYASVGNDTIATTEYIVPFSAALSRNNFYGVQFHPEKSADAGEQILKNFIEL